MFSSLINYLQDARAAGAVAVTMLFTWLTNVWEWLGPNIVTGKQIGRAHV